MVLPGEVEVGDAARNGYDETHGVLVHRPIGYVEELVFKSQESFHFLVRDRLYQLVTNNMIYIFLKKWTPKHTQPVLQNKSTSYDNLMHNQN